MAGNVSVRREEASLLGAGATTVISSPRRGFAVARRTVQHKLPATFYPGWGQGRVTAVL